MASRKRSFCFLGSPRRKRLAILPFLENLENRLVLSQSISPLVPNNLLGAADTTLLSAGSGLQLFSLAHGGTIWMLAPGASSEPFVTQGPVSSQATTPLIPQLNQSSSGAILGHLPVASPFQTGPAQQTTGPSGYIPSQILSGYGINQVSFGGIKGDGTGQTIGIFEEGSNPAFVDTSNPSYSTSALSSTKPSASQTHRVLPSTTSTANRSRPPIPDPATMAPASRSPWISSGRTPWLLGPASTSSTQSLTPPTTTRRSLKAWRPSPAFPGSR